MDNSKCWVAAAGSPVKTTTASGATYTASAASLNPAVVYSKTANATTRSFQTGSGSYTEVGICLPACHSFVTHCVLQAPSAVVTKGSWLPLDGLVTLVTSLVLLFPAGGKTFESVSQV